MTRSALLEAAIACLAEVGWSRCTVSMVAERAGVSRGAAQHHFPTREALFIAAVDQISAERRDAIRGFDLPDQTSSADHSGPASSPRSLGHVGLAAPLSTHAVVELVVELHTGPLFRAALELWVASSAEPLLRAQVVPLEAKIGREVHRVTCELLRADESEPGVREAIQATLDLARGLGLANLLTDDRRRRAGIVRQWAAMLDVTLKRNT